MEFGFVVNVFTGIATTLALMIDATTISCWKRLELIA